MAGKLHPVRRCRRQRHRSVPRLRSGFAAQRVCVRASAQNRCQLRRAAARASAAHVCGDPPPLCSSFVPFRFAYPLDHLVRGLKFRQRARLRARARPAVRGDVCSRGGEPLPQLIVPVPLAPRALSAARLQPGERAGAVDSDARRAVLSDVGRRDPPARNSGAGGTGSQSSDGSNVRGAFAAVAPCARGTSRSSMTSSRRAARSRAGAGVAAGGSGADRRSWAIAPNAGYWLKMIFERDADEHRHAEVVVVEECAQASLRLALADQQLLVQREHRRAREPEPYHSPELQLAGPRATARTGVISCMMPMMKRSASPNRMALERMPSLRSSSRSTIAYIVS